MALDYLASDPGHVMIVFNSKSLSFSLTKSLEEKIDKKNVPADVINVHGSLDKSTKCTLVKVSTGKIVIEGVNSCVLVSTSALDIGVNNPLANLVINCECPDCVTTLTQHKGRGSRCG